MPADQPLGWLPRAEVPVVINSYNRLGCLRDLITWLVRAGQRRLYVIDNCSAYPPLLDYLHWLEAHRIATVVRLGENAGHLAVWRQNILPRLGIASEFVYTDPDVVPADECPHDAIGLLQSVLAADERIAVAGLGLRLDDLPDCYRFKTEAIAWERPFWRTPAAPALFLAPIDTTFALYRPGTGHSLDRPSIRTGWPWVAAHRGWYVNDGKPTDEDLFYRRTAAGGISNWSIGALPDWLTTAAQQQARHQPSLVQIGRQGIALPGYVAASPSGEIALPSASVDGIYVDDQPARLASNPRLCSELRRVCGVDGQLVIHSGSLEPAAVREILRGQPAWMAGWHLRKAVIALHSGAGANLDLASRGLVDRLMLHLDPAGGRSAGARPEIRFGSLDYWPGFRAASA